MESYERIAGSEKLLSVFGYWPSFHDAEVVWIKLDRNAETVDKRPTLETVIHVFEITSELDPAGYYVLRNHVLVQLRFDNLVELKLDDFNHQNALMGLKILDIRARQMERIDWEVSFDGAWGVSASFQCTNATVVDVAKCDKSGTPI